MDQDQSIELVDVLLSPVREHHSDNDFFKQLTVMGKFDLQSVSDSFKVKVNLFGKTDEEQILKITMTDIKNKHNKKVVLKPETAVVDFF